METGLQELDPFGDLRSAFANVTDVLIELQGEPELFTSVEIKV